MNPAPAAAVSACRIRPWTIGAHGGIGLEGTGKFTTSAIFQSPSPRPAKPSAMVRGCAIDATAEARKPGIGCVIAPAPFAAGDFEVLYHAGVCAVSHSASAVFSASTAPAAP